MNYVVSGNDDASPVLLIHGLFGNLDNLKSLGRSLEETHQVIRVDVPNHGLSPHVSHMDYLRLADAIVATLDELNITKAHIVGHSMGGKIAMAVALYHPQRVISVIAADIAPVSYESRHQNVFNALESLPIAAITSRQQALAHLFECGLDEGTAQFLAKNLGRNETGFYWKMNLAGLKNCYQELIDWPNQDKVYSGPSLIVRGGDSDYVQIEHRNAILSQFPEVQAKTIQGTGHWLHAQKPSIFNRIIGDFIKNNDD